MRGSMTNYLVILFFLGMFMIGTAVYEEDPTKDITEISNKMTWNMTLNNTSGDPLTGIIHKAVDLFGYASFEIAKWGIEYGFEHPQYGYDFLWGCLIFLIVIGIISSILPLIFYLIALTLIANDWRKERKEREQGKKDVKKR